MMRHTSDHLTDFGCICGVLAPLMIIRWLKKHLKRLYNHNNIYLQSIALLLSDPIADNESEYLSPSTANAYIEITESSIWKSAMISSIEIIQSLSGLQPLAHVVRAIFSLYHRNCYTWKLLNGVQLFSNVPHYGKLMQKSLFGGELVYGRRHLHDGVLYTLENDRTLRHINSIFAHSHAIIPTKYRLLLIRLLAPVYPESFNCIVVEICLQEV